MKQTNKQCDSVLFQLVTCVCVCVSSVSLLCVCVGGGGICVCCVSPRVCVACECVSVCFFVYICGSVFVCVCVWSLRISGKNINLVYIHTMIITGMWNLYICFIYHDWSICVNDKHLTYTVLIWLILYIY